MDLFALQVICLKTMSPDGKSLYACSQDGTIACLQLQQELTNVAPNEQMLKQLSKYGYDRRNAVLPEAPSQLDLEEENAIINKTSSSKRIADLMGANDTTSEYQVNTTTETMPSKNGVDSSQLPQPAVASAPSEAGFTSSSTAAVTVPFEQTEKNLSKQPSDKARIATAATQLSPMEDIEYSAPLSNLPPSGIGAAVTGNKRKHEEATSDSVDAKDTAPRRKPAWVDSGLVSPMVAQSRVKLGIPTVKATITKRIPLGDKSMMIECHNTTGRGENNDYSKIVAVSQGSPIWSDYLASAAVLITGNDLFTTIGCEDGTLHVYSPAGRRDIPHERSCLAAISIAPILRVALLPSSSPQVAPTIRDVRVQKNGVPLMITSYQQAFTYHLNMNMWLRISDPWYIISEFWDGAASSRDRRTTAHPLGWLANNTSLHGGVDPISKSMIDLAGTDKETTGIVTISHIEIQLAVAALLESPEEYKDWLMFYARQLAKENAQEKADELCRWLIGPPYM
ncbi:HIR complex subunit [Apophysomyces ossiformis]|uniref:HIR complex subunit n=1 Tax=Apophysomyces ossiformis TaxID=679940 RepID=A0A8H7ET40_9FUNG|nr:HIR complex subunit [Apophysomyces ossiformis]